jgi:diguanylate cyclase (GGDEF)-like protein
MNPPRNKNYSIPRMNAPLPVPAAHFIEVYVLYGLAFLALALAVFFQPPRERSLPYAGNLWLLGMFGLFHGVKEWLDAWTLLYQPSEKALPWLDVSLLLLSFLWLFEFGRRLLLNLDCPRLAGWRRAWTWILGAWIYIPLGAGVLSLVGFAEDPVHGLEAGACYFFGFTGALASGLVLWLHKDARDWAVSPVAGYYLRVAAAALIVYSLYAGFVVAGDPAFPAWLPTLEAFYERVGIVVHVVRMICVFVLSAALVLIVREANAATRKREEAASAEVAELNANLSQRVRESTASLERANGWLRSEIEEHRQSEDRLQKVVEQLRASEQRQRDLAELAQREQSRMKALLSAMRTGILFEDRERRIEYVNPAFLRMWAIEEDFDPVGRCSGEIMEHSAHRFAQPEHASTIGLLLADNQETGESFELDLHDGRVLTQTSYPVADAESHPIGRLWLYEDITHERQTAQQLLYLAERDPLTGLYNRHRFQEQLERLIAASLRNGGRFALIYFDLDEFKHINDTYGHKAGDTVLARIAGEVGTLVRGSDTFARLGGDEFAILSVLEPGDDPGALPLRILNAVASIPLSFRGTAIRVTGSVGIAIFPEHGDNAENLVAHADSAMYQAKSHGKNTWAMYDPERELSETMRRLSWNRRIAEALQQDAFELHFQGIYDSASGALSHMEVLARMHDPANSSSLILPGQFVPAAEKSGQIVGIDRCVLSRAIELLGKNPDMPPLAVNISGRTFEDPALPRFIRSKLAAHGVDPWRLIIELTETAAVSDIQDAQRFIEGMRQAGCRVCLDDFGSGFSTFGYLKYLGVEILKIDGLFIHDLPNNRDNQLFVKAMVDVARGLHKITVAEFVEDAATLAMVRSLGVSLVQGYYLGRPRADHSAFLCG